MSVKFGLWTFHDLSKRQKILTLLTFVALVIRSRDFLFAGGAHSMQLCAKQHVINDDDGTPIAYFVCYSHNASERLCEKSHLPFDAWYSDVSIYRTCCETNASASSIQTNLTLVSGCDSLWQDPLGIKFRFCNSSTQKRTARQQSNGIIEPPSFQVLIWLMAVLSVTGNCFVLFSSFITLNKNYATMTAEKKVHFTMVINLAIADFLMGVYLFIISVVSAVFSGPQGRLQFIMSLTPLCNFLGVLSSVSSQMSVTVLVVITTARLFSVVNPYKAVNVRFFPFFSGFCWVSWIVIACVPLSNTDLARNVFEGVVATGCNRHRRVSRYSYQNVRQILDDFLANLNYECDATSAQTLWWSDSTTGPKALEIAQHLKLINENPFFLTYYSQHTLCMPQYFLDSTNPSKYFSMSILVFNFIAFMYILSVYAYIFKKVSGGTSCWKWCKKQGQRQNNSIGFREKENQDLQRKIQLIIASDFLCWVPTTILAFAYSLYLDNPQNPEICDAMLALIFPRAVFSTIVFPLNSVLNPFLYSLSNFNKVKAFFSRSLRRPNKVECRSTASIAKNSDRSEIPVSLSAS